MKNLFTLVKLSLWKWTFRYFLPTGATDSEQLVDSWTILKIWAVCICQIYWKPEASILFYTFGFWQ